MKIELIPEWRNFIKMYSVWIGAFIAVLPDLLNLAIQMEVITLAQIPPYFSWTVKTLVFAQIAARLIKQEALRREAAAQTETVVVDPAK